MALPVQINPKHNKSTLERVCFYYEENFIRGLLRGCIGGASLNCINLVVPMNIATTKLIQCRIEKMPENKAFQGIGKVGYWILASVAVKWNQSYLALCTSF